MDSILDRILNKQHAEQIRDFDPSAMVQMLLCELPEREREVVARRYGLSPTDIVETLEEIGVRLEVTRERVRQITKTSLEHLTTIGSKHLDVQHFARVAEHFLRSYGGALEEDFFVHQLLDFAGISSTSAGWERASTCLRFLLDEVLAENIEHRQPAGHLKSVYALPLVDAKRLYDVIACLVSIVSESGKPLTPEELVARFQSSVIYRNEYDQIIAEPVRIAREFYGNDGSHERTPETSEEARVVLAHAAAARDLAQNIFGEWGKQEWTTIRPRRMNDKIYLILRQEKKPLHFTTIAERINAAGFDAKVARPASIHNELILDKRFVLVGRGLYALKEWGYEPGTVSDVLIQLLKDSDGMKRDQLVAEVLERRKVKRQTIHLALMNKEKFEKLADGRFRLLA